MTDAAVKSQVIHDTPLADRHAALGARMIEVSGWRMPVQYTSILEEHRAVRERVGLFDLSRHDHEFETVRWIGFDEASTTLTFETERALVAHAGDLLAAGAGPAVERRLDASAESAS